MIVMMMMMMILVRIVIRVGLYDGDNSNRYVDDKKMI